MSYFLIEIFINTSIVLDEIHGVVGRHKVRHGIVLSALFADQFLLGLLCLLDVFDLRSEMEH